MIINHLISKVVLCHEVVDVFIHGRRQRSKKNSSFDFGGVEEGLERVGEFRGII